MDKKKDEVALNAPRTCGNIYYRKNDEFYGIFKSH